MGVAARLRRHHRRPAAALNLALRNTPALGLDLQGGVSVVLAPGGGASSGDLIVIRDLIRNELENRGIAEPDVRVEGSNIVVDLPGVKDQRQALDAVDVAGIVTLRPVLGVHGAARPERDDDHHDARRDDDDRAPAPPPTTVAGAPTTDGAGADARPTRRRPRRRRHDHRGAGRLRPLGRRARHVPADADADDPDDRCADHDGAGRPRPTPTTTTDLGAHRVDGPGESTTTVPGATSTTLPTTDLNTATSQDGQTVLRQLDGSQCLVGPAGVARATRSSPATAPSVQLVPAAGLDGRRRPQRRRRGGVERRSPRECYNGTGRRARPASWRSSSTTSSSRRPSCSSRRSAATCRSPAASARARPARWPGCSTAAPSRPRSRPQRVDTVSPTLGKDSLRASVFAGLVGVALCSCSC